MEKDEDKVKEKDAVKDKEESWLLTPSDMTPEQGLLLLSLPEHLIGTVLTLEKF